MMISEKSQLGLRFRQRDVKIKCFQTMHDYLMKRVEGLNNQLSKADENISKGLSIDHDNIIQLTDNEKLSEQMKDKVSIEELTSDYGTSYYFICDSVYKASELIKIGENFTGRTVKDIKFGSYTYLMGKSEMLRFVCVVGTIKGMYYNEKDNICFDWGIDTQSGAYFFPNEYSNQFTMIMQILTFVELGDIEVTEIKAAKNNNGKKDLDKIHNGSKNTVFVVDSSWNKIIIRTDGFAVRGHFRLQPCGANMADRRLTWIDAFEKHGYVRKAKAEIVR